MKDSISQQQFAFDKPADPQQPLWLYLHFPTLQLDLLQSGQLSTSEGEPAGLAAAVFHSKPLPLVLVNEQHQVCQANQLALAAGINTGMSLAQACALSASLQVRAWQAKLEQQQLRQIAEQLYEFTADIALAPSSALWLRLDPMLKLYKSLPALLQQLYLPLDTLGIQYQSGLAPTAAAARLFALNTPQLQLTDSAQLRQTLAPLSIRLLPIGAELQQQLQRLGIERLGQWLDLPAAELSKRFPKQLANYRQELLGTQNPSLQFIQPASSFMRRLELLWHTDQQQFLLVPLGVLLRQLQHYLQKGNRRCSTTSLLLQIPDGQDVQLQIAAPQPLQLQQHWFALWQQKLSTLQLTGNVSSLTLLASDFCQQPAAAADLLAHYPSNTNPLQLLALLQARLGDEKVRQPGLCASWLPHQANQPNNSSADKIDGKPLALPATLRQARHAPRPAFLYPEPQPLAPIHINIRSLATNSRPCLSQSWMPLQLQPGTERVCSQWWADNDKTIDYRIAYSQSGQWLWLCREAGGAWQLQGLFA